MPPVPLAQVPGMRSCYGSLPVDTQFDVWPAQQQELKARNVQHARNIFDRAVSLLPRVDVVSPSPPLELQRGPDTCPSSQLWYKYVFLEELLLNVPGARQVFERWMTWEPDDKVRLEPACSRAVRHPD